LLSAFAAAHRQATAALARQRLNGHDSSFSLPPYAGDACHAEP